MSTTAGCGEHADAGQAGVVFAELDLSRIAAGRRMFDPTGHYARPDVLSFRQPAFGQALLIRSNTAEEMQRDVTNRS